MPEWFGLGVSPGQAEGRRVDVDGYRNDNTLAVGAQYILVGETIPIDIAELSPLIVGVVMEDGGLLSHGAIIAREYGLPAVAGIPIDEIPSGAELIVDGNAGLVRAIDV